MWKLPCQTTVVKSNRVIYVDVTTKQSKCRAYRSDHWAWSQCKPERSSTHGLGKMVVNARHILCLKLGLNFCTEFLASSELIRYIDLTDSYDIWPKCSLVINVKKGVRLFWYSKYFSFLRALMWRRLANIQFANFKIDFLSKQSEYRRLTPFCSHHHKLNYNIFHKAL